MSTRSPSPRRFEHAGIVSGLLVLTIACECGRAGQARAAPGLPSSQLREALGAPSRPEKSYLDRLAAFHTKLVRHGPSPQASYPIFPPPGVQEITFKSGDLTLRAWVQFPPGASATHKVPGIVYLHGGFAFGPSDLDDAKPFLNAGLAVLCPMLRGENGNPGDFEAYGAEVNDAEAALRWLSAQDRIDATHLYTFGHSAGGIISALLSLRDLPIRYGGSAGGLYSTSIFDLLRSDVPFDPADTQERQMRVLVGNIKWMQRPHYGYVGEQDRHQAVAQAEQERADQPLLKIINEPGNHLTSLAASVDAFARVLKETP